MENLLRSKEYWCVVETGIPTEGENVTAAQRKNIDEMKLKDLKAKNYLFSSIDKSILKTITKKDTSKQLWDSMKMRYQGSARVQRAQLNRLRRDFEILAMRTGESIIDYFGRVMAVANEMRNYEDSMDDVKIVDKILRTLTDKWNFMICSIEESKDIDEMIVDELQSSLLVHEQKFKQNHDGDEFECPKWDKETNYDAISEAGGGEESEQLLLMDYTPEVTKSDVWFLDSGCSNHISGDPSWFSNLNQNHTTTVKLRSNMIMKAVGQCNVKIKLNGVTHIVSDVYYVPELRNNFLAWGNYKKEAEPPFQSVGKEESCLITKGQDLTQLLHIRLGHLNYTMLKKLQSKEMVQGLPLLENVSEVCKDCLGMSKRFWVKAVNWRNYVLNICPNAALIDMTPEEAWSGNRLSISHLCIFGCLSNVYIPQQQRTKLDDRSDWIKTHSKEVLVDLEWDDEVITNESDVAVVTNKVVATNEDDAFVEENTHHGRVNEAVTRSGRNVQPPRWMNDYASGDELENVELKLTMAANSYPVSDPLCFNEAELKPYEYKTKLNENGKLQKHKARLVAKGYSQGYGVDYLEVYAPVAHIKTVRTIIAVAAQQRWKIFQLDVISAFLHGKLNEDVYVDQPQGFEVKGSENKVYKLHMALYGLKQAPRAWFNMIDSYFVAEGFEKCPNAQTLFTKKNNACNFLIVSICMDDLIYTGDDETMLKSFKESMMKSFDMTDLGIMRYFLGIEVLQGNGGKFISQRRYATEVLNRFGMFECKAVKTPIAAVGMKLNKDESGVVNLKVYQRNIGYRVMYQARMGGLIGYTDSDYARDTDDRINTSGYVFMLSIGVVSWLSKKQPIVTLSTTEAEFVAVTGCSSQSIWLMRVLEKLGCASKEGVTIYCDNNSTIKLSKNPVMHGWSKHIDVCFHFLRELV
uniref:Retrovirus-related Pol polyprotein from transposon TNT 1-94 n=1 Tax=Tanacetum cinerariifolium TaxID=118510 RepID=A0A6L2L9V4_TANCI|nr:hypothetical protein [Tanacetum cinerariifolium]